MALIYLASEFKFYPTYTDRIHYYVIIYLYRSDFQGKY